MIDLSTALFYQTQPKEFRSPAIHRPAEIFAATPVSTTLRPVIKEAIAAGVSGIIVDWEHVEKKRRQGAADTEIN